MIRFACPSCGKGFRVGADKAGRRVSCPGCGNALDIPTEPPTSFDNSRGHGLAHCTEWNQLDGLLAEQNGEPQPVRLSRASEDRFRSALTAHADAVPGHTVERLGDAITVESVEAVPVYRVRLDSLYECRRVEPRQRSHAGEHLPPATVTVARLDPWSFDASSPDGFAVSTDELPVEGSQRIETCGRCGGVGGTPCQSCGETGAVTCFRCGGGGTEECGTCSGRGIEVVVVGSRSEPRDCRSCLGGYVVYAGSEKRYPCMACRGNGVYHVQVDDKKPIQCRRCLGGGREVCTMCGGKRSLKCKSCSGSARLMCEGCRGSGQIVSYLAIVRSFDPGSTARAASEIKVPGRLIDRLEECERDPVIDVRTTDVPNLVHLTAGPADMRDAIEQAFAESVGGCPADHRVARQRLSVGLTNVHRVKYQYGGKSYSAWWMDTPDNPLLASITSPLADAVGDLVNEALRLWEGGERRAAALMLQDVVAMAKSDRRCREVLDDRRADIPPELWSLAGRVFSPTKALGRGWKTLKRNPALLVVLVVVGGAMLLGIATMTIGMLARPKDQPRQQVREVRDAEPKPGRDPRYDEPRPRDEPRPVVPPAAPDNFITAEYWPITPGTTRQYDEVRYEEGRAPGRATRKRVSYLADGSVETSVIREGVLESGTLLGGGKITWRTTTPQRPTTARIRRTAEFVEYGVGEPGGITWLPVMKLGARVGNSWIYPVTDDTRQRDRVARFDLRDGRPCVVIEGVINPTGSDEVIGETTDVLVRGVGLVERRQFVVRNGKKLPLSERVRVEE